MATVYDVITQQIVESLEKGTVPWKKPWNSGLPTIDGKPVLNQNLFTKNPYRGVNWLLTALSPFSSPFWVPRGEIRKRSLSIKEGEKYTPIVYFKWRSEEDIAKEAARGRVVAPCFARFFKVWNIEQLDGVDLETIPQLDSIDRKEHKPIQEAIQLVDQYKDKPTIQHKEDGRAYYNATRDFINMPDIGLFDSPEEYHGTLFHELVHSTGHKSRLSRESLTDYSPFGSVSYSKEELIAEIGSCFLCSTVGIATPETFQNSAAYIEGWLGKIKKDSRLVLSAAQQAQKAVDAILQTKLKKLKS